MESTSHIKKWLLASLIIGIIVSVSISIWLLLFNRSGRAPLWRQGTVHGFDNFGTATYKDGILYAPSKADNKVYAVNASNGNIIWSHTVRQCDASPCIDGEVIYVGECIGPEGERQPSPKALALNRSTGEEVWSFIEPDNREWVGSPLVNGDYVYYTTYGSGVYALNKTNGNPIWHRAEAGFIVCSVAFHNGVVFVSAYDPPGQYALNATTGESVWQANYGASWDSSPVVYNGMVIQVTFNRTTKVWSTNVLNETSGNLLRRFEGTGSPSTPLVHNGKIFIPSDDWRIWAFSLANGEELWNTARLDQGVSTQDLGSPNLSYGSPALAEGVIYHQSLSGMFCAISETDGRILWSSTLGGYGFGSPSIGDGHVFITNDSALYAYEIDSGPGDWPMFCKNSLHQSVSG
jgi:outer membrane protein assembly factor BamB